MKKLFAFSFIASVSLGFAACESQRTTSAAETTTTTESVTSAPTSTTETNTTPPASGTDTTMGNMQPTDAGNISPEIAAMGAFTSDVDFATKAVAAGMAEVKFGALAERKAVKPEVKQFGVQMVQDHTRANNVLIRLSQKRKWSTPSEMDVEHQQAYSKLATVMSDEFDQGYMAQMVKDHEMAVAMFQEAATKATDAELKAFATSTLPNLKMHLGMARDLQKQIEASR